jgi:hypothetical protein
MVKLRLRIVAMLCSLAAMSCGSPSQPGLFSGAPTGPTTVTSLSEPGAAVEPRSTRPPDLDEINSATARSTLTISGVVTDKAYPAWKISSATITITPGPLATRTSSTGQYTARVRAGTYTIKIAKSGYATATIRKTVSGTTTVNSALNPKKPSGATARCKDRTWSKSQNRSGTCSHHKGVAYWVCPGKLCR